MRPMKSRTRALWVAGIFLFASSWARSAQRSWPFDVTDLSEREKLVVLVLGDSGTGNAGQYRVGQAMYETCRQRGCDLALMLGDNIYENGIEVKSRTNVDASYREILDQFDQKFESPYRAFEGVPGFRFWVVLGNHDYRKNAVVAMLTYSEFSKLWRFPAFHYEIPLLPQWIQIYALHTDTDERRDLNGLQVTSAKRALCAERNPDRWKLAFGHQPVYNSGHHRGDSQEQRTRALLESPLFRECGVHVYLAGHAHHQEHLTAQGFEQIIQGAAARTKGSSKPPRSPSVQQRHFSQNFGFAVVEVDPMRIQFDFYDVLHTREKASEVTTPRPEEIVLAYSWCGAKQDIGQPNVSPVPCP